MPLALLELAHKKNGNFDLTPRNSRENLEKLERIKVLKENCTHFH